MNTRHREIRQSIRLALAVGLLGVVLGATPLAERAAAAGVPRTLAPHDAPTLAINPTSGAYGQTVTLTGTGFQGSTNELVDVMLDSPTGMPVYAAQAANDGSFVIQSNVYWQAVNGAHTLYAVGQTSGLMASTVFTINARITAQPRDGNPGTITNIRGFGFGAREQVKVYWDSPSMLLGTGRSSAVGRLGGANGLNVTVPLGSARGPHTITAVGQSTGATATVTFRVL